jgi:hypothetical protein
MDVGFAEGCKPNAIKSKCPWKKKSLFVPKIEELYIEYEVKE